MYNYPRFWLSSLAVRTRKLGVSFSPGLYCLKLNNSHYLRISFLISMEEWALSTSELFKG